MTRIMVTPKTTPKEETFSKEVVEETNRTMFILSKFEKYGVKQVASVGNDMYLQHPSPLKNKQTKDLGTMGIIKYWMIYNNKTLMPRYE